MERDNGRPILGLPRFATTPALFAVVGLLALTACSGKPVRLGTARPPPFGFDAPRLVAELGDAENPTLTQDLREIFFTSGHDTGQGTSDGNVWFARRSSPTATFSAPVQAAEVNTPGYETSAAISADGLTLWLGSDRDAPAMSQDLDIWSAVRTSRTGTWSAPSKVSGLNSTARDVPRPLGDHGLTMPLSSERDSPDLYRTFFATRPSADQPFATPTPLPELIVAGHSVVDAFLSDDGLTLFFASGGAGEPQDLFVAFREHSDEAFSLSEPLTDLNTSADERDPWLSSDGSAFFFTSNRAAGILNIYESKVHPR